MQKYIKDITIVGVFLLCYLSLMAQLHARMKPERQKWHKFVYAAITLFFLPLPISFLRSYLLPNPNYIGIFDAFYVTCLFCAFALLIIGNKQLKKEHGNESDGQQKNEFKEG
jgi:hypothetical protein